VGFLVPFFHSAAGWRAMPSWLAAQRFLAAGAV
jgi:hypothetical protein